MRHLSVQALLKLYWDSKTQIELGPVGTLTHRLKTRASIEMLHRVDQGAMPVDALPPDVRRTWYTIYQQPVPENYREPCDYYCEFQEPYGYVPEAGCPVHDAEEVPSEA